MTHRREHSLLVAPRIIFYLDMHEVGIFLEGLQMQRTIFTKSMIATGMWLGLSVAAFAGPQYIDETGYAISGYDAVAFHSLKKGEPAVPGKASITTQWNGSKWAFASEENKQAFLANPTKYAPEYDGHCAYGIAKGGKVPGNPNLWAIVKDKLYFNINPPVQGFWEEDIPGFIKTADTNWSTAESKAASTESWTAIAKNKPTYKVVGPVE